MPSLIEEHTQFIDPDTGKPIVNGSVYIGTQNQDPEANPITIYSDRALTTTISNPQSTDSSGRTTNKIWVPGKYSIKVTDSADVQKYQELDNGDDEQTGITILDNVAGTNTITAEGSPDAVTSLTDGQQYNFKAAGANTGAVTLQIDLTSAKSIRKLHDDELVSGDILTSQVVSVIYNSTDDWFELVSNVAAATFVDLTVSNNLTVGNAATVNGDTVAVKEAAPTGYTRAGNVFLLDGDTALTRVQVDSVVIEGAWESIGPTGSGADNIWADMDNIPANGAVIVVDIDLDITGTGSILLYAVSGDVASPSASTENNRIAIYENDGFSTIRRQIALGASNIFKINWDQVATSARSIDLKFRGFIVD